MIDARRAVRPIHGSWVGSGFQKLSPELSWVGQVEAKNSRRNMHGPFDVPTVLQQECGGSAARMLW